MDFSELNLCAIYLVGG